MWTRVRAKDDPSFIRDFERGVLRTTFVSLFAAVIASKKETEGFTLSKLADTLGINKSTVSRWFNGEPNWEINTIADIADALEVDITVTAKDRLTGTVYGASGILTSTDAVPALGGDSIHLSPSGSSTATLQLVAA